ncbi:MAG: leucyl aminopeptidase [Micavibrio sp.]|nr:MAG: leucyl aminopeptidase [Micavibrio sp.]
MLKAGFTGTMPKNAGVIAVFAGKKGALSKNAKDMDKKTGGALSRAVKASTHFEGKLKQSLVVSGAGGGVDHIIVLGTAGGKKLSATDLESLGATLVKALKDLKQKSAAVLVDLPDGADSAAETAARFAFGAALHNYSFDLYRTKKKDTLPKTVEKLDLVLGEAAAAKKLYAPMEKIAAGVFFTRDLVSEPPNVLYPESFVDRVKKELTPLGVKIQVLTEKQMEKMGMGAIIGVGKGSVRPPRMVVMQYDGLPKNAPAAAKKPVAFVGKGITFDTGGISLKPGAGMEEMKWDMGGAGTVSGLMKALAGRKAKINAIGILALAENMPDGNATRPGDVLTSLSGQTIEVLNTDAEGRLVLADAMWYVQDKFKPKVMIDLATLTGAIIIALGHEYAGIFSNDDDLPKHLMTAGEDVSEKTWHMPMCTAWDKAIDSDIADMKNIGGRDAGSSTAAAFLKRFVKDGTVWAHLDIAGVAWSKKDRPTVPKGGTGFGVRLLDHLVATHYEAK